MIGPREYPVSPIVGVGAVVFQASSVLLVRRAQAPLAGEWSLPGGAVELGETLEQAVVREVAEETGLCVMPAVVLKALDYIDRDADGRIRFHYVLVDFLCRLESSKLQGAQEAPKNMLRPDTDISEARWVPMEGLRTSEDFPLAERTLNVIFAGWNEARETVLFSSTS